MSLNIEKINSLSQEQLNAKFFIFCEEGNLKNIKFLFTNSDLLLRPKIEDSFYNPLRLAAQRGHIKVLEYLLTSPDLRRNLNIHSDNDYALISACEKNHLKTVKFLLTSPRLKEHANIHAQKDGALKKAILYNNLAIAHYLITSNDLQNKANANEALLEVCYSEDLDGLKFLTSKEIKPFIDIHYNNDEPFKILINYEHINLIKYLINDYHIDINENIKKMAKNNNQEIWKLIQTKELNDDLNNELKPHDEPQINKKLKL